LPLFAYAADAIDAIIRHFRHAAHAYAAAALAAPLLRLRCHCAIFALLRTLSLLMPCCHADFAAI